MKFGASILRAGEDSGMDETGGGGDTEYKLGHAQCN